MPVRPKPTCPLCSGALERQRDVIVANDSFGGSYYLAWVCIECSAAFPVACARKFGQKQPLFRKGTDAESGTSRRRGKKTTD